jgi:hypothetical protein
MSRHCRHVRRQRPNPWLCPILDNEPQLENDGTDYQSPWNSPKPCPSHPAHPRPLINELFWRHPCGTPLLHHQRRRLHPRALPVHPLHPVQPPSTPAHLSSTIDEPFRHSPCFQQLQTHLNPPQPSFHSPRLLLYCLRALYHCIRHPYPCILTGPRTLRTYLRQVPL